MTSPARAARTAPRRVPASAPPAPRPDLRVVPATTRRLRPGVVVALSAVIVFATLILSAVAHSFLVSGQAELDRMATEVRQEREGLEADRVVLAAHQSPQRIAEEAERLGMVPAETQTWISPGTGAAPVVVGGDHGGADVTEEAPPATEHGPSSADQPGSSELASAAPTPGDRP